MPRLALLIALPLFSLSGCVVYEYEQEFWIQTDGSGTVSVTGRPELWDAFKGLKAGDALPDRARRLFEDSGLEVSRARITYRGGRPYLFLAASFKDVNRLGGTPAFPDLAISFRESDDRAVLDGRWVRPEKGETRSPVERDGLMAVRFHLPSKIYSHKNAALGVERGNILGWRQEVSAALDSRPLSFGATLDRRSILWSTVSLFLGAILLALLLLATVLSLVRWKGRRVVAESPPSPFRDAGPPG